MTKNFAIAAVAALALASAACGTDDGEPSDAGAAKTVEVEMVDIAYDPDTIKVAKGEEVEFVFVNNGKIRHEAFLGTTDEQRSHGEEMREGGESSSGHDAHGGGGDVGSKVSVEPGKRGSLTTQFEEAGTYEIGCHEPGHYDAGMRVTVEVS